MQLYLPISATWSRVGTGLQDQKCYSIQLLMLSERIDRLLSTSEEKGKISFR